MIAIASLMAYALYFFIIAFIGYSAYRSNQKSGDYTLGNRSLNYWVTALAANASDMSGWLFMAFPAMIYTQGLIHVWTAIGLTGFMLANWILVAPKLRTMTEYHGSATLSSFFEKRFNDKSGTLRLISAIASLIFLTVYISANLAALGHLFESIFGMGYLISICVGSLVVFYTLLGGYTSIAWIDCFQGIFLLGAIILVPWVAIKSLGGISGVLAHAQNAGAYNFMPNSMSDVIGRLLIAASWGLGYFGQPHIVTKFMGIDDAANLKKARWVGFGWQVLALSAAVMVGLTAYAFFLPGSVANSELIFVHMTKALFHPFIAGLILCAIIASALNVTGAQVLASASVLAEDFFKHWLHARKHLIPTLSRLCVIGICILALAIAYANEHTALGALVHYAWSGLGASFSALMLVALHTRMKSKVAAIAGVTVGALVGGLWPLLGSSIPALVAGFFASLAAMGLLNLFRK